MISTNDCSEKHPEIARKNAPKLTKGRNENRKRDSLTKLSLNLRLNRSILVNSRFFDGDISKVPTTALTVGVGTVMDAKEVLVLAFGHKKANALREAIEGAYSHKCTLSALQAHPHGIIVADELAVGELKVNTYRYFKDIEKDNLL